LPFGVAAEGTIHCHELILMLRFGEGKSHGPALLSTEFFREKLDRLFDIEIFYAIVIEGTRSKTGIAAAFSRLPHDPKGGLQELKAQFSNDKLKVLLREQDRGRLAQAGAARSQLRPSTVRLRGCRDSAPEPTLPLSAAPNELQRLANRRPSQQHSVSRLPSCEFRC